MTCRNLDAAAAHRFFSAACFNQAWELIEKRDRNRDDDEQMLLVSQASLWHWTQRSDCTSTEKSIGYWQLSRIHALLGRADASRRYAHLSLEHSREDQPFLVGYAYEAMARAERVANNRAKSDEHVAQARRLAELVSDPEDKELLLKDLQSLTS